MDLERIKKLIDLLEKRKISKFSLKEKDFEIFLEKEADKKVFLEKEVFQEKEKNEEDKKNEYFIKSPMVGTFYEAPAEKKPPFVKEGDMVEENTVVCIIEAMKVMNEVKAGKKGILKEVLCKNGNPVEFGTKLFKIEKI